MHEVQDRDLRKLNIPPNAHRFYFFDSPTNSKDPYDAQDDQQNLSAFYIVAARVITSEEAAKLRKKPRPPRGKDAGKIVALGKTSAELGEAFWQVSLKTHSHFAVTRQGKIIPVGKDEIVINERFEELYPKPVRTQAANDVVLIRLPEIRRRKP